jgi:hypothetical protein
VSLTDTLIKPYADRLLVCLATQMGRHAKPPAKVEFRVGATGSAVIGPDEDECCAGLAWVRVAGAQPGGEQPPATQTTLMNCGPMNWILTFELGVARCMNWGSGPEGLDPPLSSDWTQALDYQEQDFVAMTSAVQCCFSSAGADRYTIGAWQPTDIEAGCTASTLSVTVLANRPCPISC